MCNFCYLKKNKHLIVLIWVLFLTWSVPCFSQVALQEDMEKDRAEVEFLLGISQLILKDRDRLKNLKADSIALEPFFIKIASRFNRVGAKLADLKSLDTLNRNPSSVQSEGDNLKGELEYILKKRRAIHQQLEIIERKISVEREVFSLAMKGKSTLVMELIANGRLKNDKTINLDSLNPAHNILQDDNILFDRIKIEYDWDIVENERELEILKANFEIAKKKWELVQQLLAINQDDFATVQYLLKSSREQMHRLNNLTGPVKNKSGPLQGTDTQDQAPESRLDTTETDLAPVAEIQNNFAQDSLLLGDIEIRIENLSKLKAPLRTEVTLATEKIVAQKNQLEYLRSPWSLRGITSFILNKGPRIIILVLILFLIWVSTRWIVAKVLQGLSFRKLSPEDRSQRAETLRRTIHSSITVVMFFVGALLLLSEFGIDVSIILGGAAVFSLAIAFGAQSLVKDFFSGFMILSEDQYRVGNVIKINQFQGVVEDISLRTTILRDQHGVAHFIPHGDITTVSNLTHKWSRVALEIGIAYKENVDQVMEVIMKVAQELRSDADFRKLITDDPEMLGVDELGDSAVIIKVMLKTKPQKQWLVKRELLRRLKNRFDELDIEIPFPHRTIYMKELPRPIFKGKKQE